jgi:ligand-binding SRPBCC domain-containing protein
MMIFLNSFKVEAPLEQVADFHSRSASLAAISPPPVIIRLDEAPQSMSAGDEMSFTLWLGPLPIRWKALITKVTETGFVDLQVEGPFEKWEHHHTFTSVSPSTTLVNDEIHVTLSNQLSKTLVGLGMMVGLPFLLRYRAWRTQRLLTQYVS